MKIADDPFAPCREVSHRAQTPPGAPAHEDGLPLHSSLRKPTHRVHGSGSFPQFKVQDGCIR